MIPIKSAGEIRKMREAGAALKEVFGVVAPLVAPGITTMELNAEIEKKIFSLGASAPCKGYEGYPAAACISRALPLFTMPSAEKSAEQIPSLSLKKGDCASAIWATSASRPVPIF